MSHEAPVKWSQTTLDIVKSMTGLTEDNDNFIDLLVEVDMARTPKPLNFGPVEATNQPKNDINPTDAMATAPQGSIQKNHGLKITDQKNPRENQKNQRMKKSTEGPVRKRRYGEWYDIYPTPTEAPRTPTY